MAIDWDADVLGPAMSVFGEGDACQSASWPLYQPIAGVAFRLADAVFDAEYQTLDTTPGDDVGQTSNKPILGVRLSLFAAPPKQGDSVFIAATAMNRLPAPGATFRVIDPQPDGHGHAKLILMGPLV